MTFVWISTWLPSCGKLKFHKKTSTSWRVESIEGCDSSMCDSSGEKGGRKFIYESSWQRPEMAPRLTFCMLTAPKKKPHRRKRRKNLWDQKETTNSQSNYSGLNPCPQLPPPEKSLSVLLIISSGLRPARNISLWTLAAHGKESRWYRRCVRFSWSETAGGKRGKARIVGKFLTIKRRDLFTQVLIQWFNGVFACTLSKSWMILWFLEVPQERSKVPYPRRGLAFGALENPEIHEWISNFHVFLWHEHLIKMDTKQTNKAALWVVLGAMKRTAGSIMFSESQWSWWIQDAGKWSFSSGYPSI